MLAGTTAGTEYTQIVADGTITLGCTLHATSTATGPFPAGTQFLVIDGDPVSGTFTGLAQGAHTPINGQDFTVDYAHGGVRLTAQGGADMASTAPADLAAPNDLATGESDLGADLATATPPDAATGSGSHSGCAYALGDAAPSGAASIFSLLVLLALARRATRKPADSP